MHFHLVSLVAMSKDRILRTCVRYVSNELENVNTAKLHRCNHSGLRK